MARRTSRSSSSRSSGRTAKATSRKPAATEVEVVEEADDGNMDSGMAIMTTLVLVAAFLMVDKLRGMYDEGMFF